MEHTKLYINRMTCINCQTQIQNALKKLPGITRADVSYETETADVLYDSSVISLEQIQGLINELGYSASVQKASHTKIVGQILRELGIIVILYFLLRHFGILNYLAPASLADAQMSYGMLFVIGLITSVHCIAMCGGINLSQTLQKDSEPSANVSRAMFQNAAAYNAGRIISYTIIGGILGGIGAFTKMKGISKRSDASHRRKTPFIIGLFNGLMPCGPLQSMQIVALASANIVTGALSMFFFALGTIPLMLGFGSIVAGLGKHFTKQVLKCGAILVVVMGLS